MKLYDFLKMTRVVAIIALALVLTSATLRAIGKRVEVQINRDMDRQEMQQLQKDLQAVGIDLHFPELTYNRFNKIERMHVQVDGYWGMSGSYRTSNLDTPIWIISGNNPFQENAFCIGNCK